MQSNRDPFPLRTPDRRRLFQEFSETEIRQRYIRNFRLTDDIGFNDVKKHAALEAELTDSLLASTAENRAVVFETAYSRLYSELPWLVDTGSQSGGEHWLTLMRPGSRVYEIGSGAGYLVNYLAERGMHCCGTDIASDRAKHATRSGSRNLEWDVTDGVNLTRYAEETSYDYLISNQVVEHLHPHDILMHFKEARRLLKVGGKYIVSTPYAPFGPADLSSIFGLSEPEFMHLHEFCFADMTRISKACDYSQLTAVLSVPKTSIRIQSLLYFKYLSFMEKFLRPGESGSVSETLRRHRGAFLLRNTIWAVFTR